MDVDHIINTQNSLCLEVGEKSKMASPFEGDGVRVLLTCSCSALSPPARLYFCRHCIKLRCPLCVSHEVILSEKKETEQKKTV